MHRDTQKLQPKFWREYKISILKKRTVKRMNFLAQVKSEVMWSVYGNPGNGKDFYEDENQFFAEQNLRAELLSLSPRAVGVDASKWEISYSKNLVATSQDFFVMRASYGMKTDQKYFEFLPEIEKVGIRGAYHYMSSWDGTWKQQADNFLNLASKGNFHFLVVDFESAGGNVLSNTFAGMTVEFAKYCEKQTGKKAVLYTGGYLFRDWIMKYYPLFATSVPLWIAQYPNIIPNPQTASPSMLKEIKTPWVFWQYSGDKNTFGKANGFGSIAADVDVFNGSVEEMKEYFGITNGEIPPPVVVEPPIIVEPPPIIPVGKPATVMVDSLNVRSGAGTFYPIAQTSLKLGDKIIILSTVLDNFGNTWGNIALGKWVCMIFQGKQYVRFDEAVSPPQIGGSGMITTFTTPATGNYAQVVHDYEIGEPRSITLNYKKDPPANALPETFELLNPKEGFFPLSDAWQLWWYSLLRVASYNLIPDEELREAWRSLTEDSRAFTDHHSRVNGFTDYVLGINLYAKKPMMIKSLTTGGNLVKILSRSGTRFTIECLNFSKAPPPVEDVWLKKPWLYQWATSESVLKLPDKSFRVLSFPQLHSYNGTPVPVGSFDGTQIIDRKFIKLLQNGKTYHIYNP
jgi:GH25 family lysozyme M1 (1,4-beta-N-acetylmuramidase)